MKVNMKTTMDILDKASKVTIKHCEQKNLTFEVHKLTSFRNALKQWGK